MGWGSILALAKLVSVLILKEKKRERKEIALSARGREFGLGQFSSFLVRKTVAFPILEIEISGCAHFLPAAEDKLHISIRH